MLLDACATDRVRAMTRWWLAVVGPITTRDLAGGGWHHLRAAVGGGDRPAPGDRIAVLSSHRPRYVSNARFVGTVDVRSNGEDLAIRHRFVAPPGHEPALADVAHLHASVAWTDERLAALIGGILPLSTEDGGRIERVVRERALSFGPPAMRPPHRRPRTPGRRALLSARVIARRLPSFH